MIRVTYSRDGRSETRTFECPKDAASWACWLGFRQGGISVRVEFPFSVNPEGDTLAAEYESARIEYVRRWHTYRAARS